MADIADPSGASLRLSNDERERAVAALQAHAAQGRLTDAELETRSAAARAAVTRGDLAPLFADLPGGLHFDAHAPQAPQAGAQPAGAGAASPGPQYAQPYAAAQPYATQQPYAPQQPSGAQAPYDGRGSAGWGGREPSSRWGLLAVSIIPFVSLILFFITGAVWGYQFSWLWFLLIPLVGAIAYGTDGGRRR